MPRLKHSIPAELPAPEQLDHAQIARDYAAGRIDLLVVLGYGRLLGDHRIHLR